ncbi:hypothetical protein LA080_000711 [Diaporthe eres]|nr:hypothetical protein LA080_000711 [Diaporthe eres]
MSRQAGIKEFFPTDKAIDSRSASATPSVLDTPSIPPAPPPVPPAPSVSVTASGLGTSSTSATPSLEISASLKRGASQAHQSEPAHKRVRVGESARDDAAPAVSTEGAVNLEPDFPNGPLTVWAMTRGDLCDSQHTFKSYQGGTQTKKNVAISLLIDKYTEPRDFLGRNKLITCAGGGREKEDGNGQYKRKDTKPKVVSRLEAALDTPIVVIMGKGHPAFENLNLPNVVRKHGHFVELGTFMLTKIWKEMVKPNNVQEPYQVWKIMFQTMDSASRPWYWKETIDNASTMNISTRSTRSTRSTTAGTDERACNGCGNTSPKIFANASWVCLEDDCEQFFRVAGNILSQIGDDNKELRYSEAFIDHIITYEEIASIPTLFEPLRGALVEGGDQYGTEVALRGGMTCPKCRCGTARKYWDRLACRNCGFEHNVAPLPYPLSMVEKETEAHTKSCRVKDDGVTIELDEDHVQQFVENDQDGMSTRLVYMIKHANGDLIGSFVVERPSDVAKKAPGGADELYTSIESEGGSMKFQRNASRCPDTYAEQLTGHFQSNFGALYEFGPKGIDTQPFTNAPDVVLQSLAYLKHFGEKALKSSQRIAESENCRPIAGSTLHMPQKPFNELLALAYRQTDQIGYIKWHDDGEDQLTGVISTASFGSPGKMALRFKKNGKAVKKGEITLKKGETILEVQLRHGDVATMCDTRLQALTDHTVIPDGIRRYAMTSRTINFDHYKQQKQKAKLVQRGLAIDEMEEAAQLPDHALHFAYNGTTLGHQQDETA